MYYIPAYTCMYICGAMLNFVCICDILVGKEASNSRRLGRLMYLELFDEQIRQTTLKSAGHVTKCE